MASVTEILDFSALLGPLRELGWDRPALGPLLNQVRQLGLESARLCFATGTDPDGRPWVPSKKPRGKTGVKTGRTRAATRGRVEGAKVVWTNGSPVAGFLFRGTRRMPARNALGLGERSRPELERLLADFLRAAEPE